MLLTLGTGACWSFTDPAEDIETLLHWRIHITAAKSLTVLQARLASLQGWQGPSALSPRHRGRHRAPGDSLDAAVHWYQPDCFDMHGGCCDCSRLRSAQKCLVLSTGLHLWSAPLWHSRHLQWLLDVQLQMIVCTSSW